MNRIRRSFTLVGQSYRVLMQDKELMVLPIISGTISVALAVSFFFAFEVTSRFDTKDEWLLYVPLFLFYMASYAIGIYFQAAVIAGATERMRGGDPTVGSALRAAGERSGAILMWAIVAATVGMILRLIRDRSEFIGRLVAAFAGAAWSMATFFIVPVLVLERRSVRDSFSKSCEVFGQMWGETFVGGASIGVATLIAWFALFGVFGLLQWAGLTVSAFAVLIAGGIGLGVMSSALQGVFVAACYQHATGGSPSPQFDRDLLSNAFREKR